MFNAIAYHYKMEHKEIGKLTIHQFNSKVEFLNKMFSDKETKDNSSNNYAILDRAFGAR